MNKEVIISDELANSIRELWHIESLEEKKKIIRHYNNLCRLFLLVKNHPNYFSLDELEKCNKKIRTLNQTEKDLISEIFLTLHMGIINYPLEYTVEEMKELYSKGLYFTKEELEEMIDWQFYSKKHNTELIALIEEYLDKHLYFNTIDEAELVWNASEISHHGKKHNKSKNYLSNCLSKVFISQLSQ